MPRPVKYSDDAICEALRESLGIQTLAAQKLGCNRASIAERAKRSARVREAMAEARETRLDLAESKLFAGINNGEPWAIKFILSTQGGSRGYKECQEIEVKAPGANLAGVPTAELERIVAERSRGLLTDGGGEG